MMSDEEYDLIRNYLDDEIDWEVLVKFCGEDMARGVRIAEEHFKGEETSSLKKKIGEDILRGGYVAQAIKESFGFQREGERS